MKKILICFALALVFSGFEVLAAFQFNESEVTFGGVTRTENYLSFDGKTSVFLDFDDDYFYSFGYYKLGTPSADAGVHTFVAGSRRTGYLGTFDENDQIGIWVKPYPAAPYRYTTTVVKDWNVNTVFAGTEYDIDQDDDKDADIDFTLGTHMERKGFNWKPDGYEFEIIAPYAAGGGGTGNSSISGQPLPGALSSMFAMLAAGSGLVMSDRRKKKQQLRK